MTKLLSTSDILLVESLKILRVRNFCSPYCQVFINGFDNNETREWFKRHSGYVLQLATPYHEELTVRENLTFSAIMRLPKTMSTRNKLMRVEQVIGQVCMVFVILSTYFFPPMRAKIRWNTLGLAYA